MAIRYLPDEFLKKAAPKSKIKKALRKNLSLKKTALTNAAKFDFLDKDAIAEVALKTVKSYKERSAKAAVDAGFDREAGDALAKDLAANPAQLVQRVQNEVIWQVKEKITDRYRGESYTWLPSDAEDPRPEHQLNYGKVFQVGDGEMPGDALGCRCGMEILVDDSRLDL